VPREAGPLVALRSLLQSKGVNCAELRDRRWAVRGAVAQPIRTDSDDTFRQVSAYRHGGGHKALGGLVNVVMSRMVEILHASRCPLIIGAEQSPEALPPHHWTRVATHFLLPRNQQAMPGRHFHGEEVCSGEDLPVALEELRPAHARFASLWGWFHMMAVQEVAHGQLVNVMSKVSLGALDAAIAPRRTLFRHRVASANYFNTTTSSLRRVP
jgi:hypothetical protein